MRTWAFLAALAFVTASQAEEKYHKYNATDIKRFKDELRHLGVVLPDTKPDQPEVIRDPVVTSPAGDFEGFWTKSRFARPIASFEGIPFAQPPVGPLRFKLAQTLPRLPATLKAVKPGNKCPQIRLVNYTMVVDGDEDCLFINVYVPERTKRSKTELLPVIFYVQGGAFVSGQGDSMKPGILLDSDVVLVTFNYRLGVLGFLTTQDETIPGNLGLKDQLAALLWTKKNIASFGGNPNLITVFGISAGGASAEHLMLSPLTRGHIQRVISTSGSASSEWATISSQEMRANVRKAAEVLRCPAEPSRDLLDCLRKRTTAEVTPVFLYFAKWGQRLPEPFRPIVEGNIPGALIPDSAEKLFSSANRSNDVPFMTGCTSEEGTFVGTVQIFNDSVSLRKYDQEFSEVLPAMLYRYEPDQRNKTKYEILKRAYFGTGPLTKSQTSSATDLFTDSLFMWPAMKSVKAHVIGAKSPAYFYYFSFQGSRTFLQVTNGPRLGEYGVGHADDALYLFPYPGNITAEDAAMMSIYSDLYTSFARDGVPSTKVTNLTWLPSTPREFDIPYLHINSPVDIKNKKSLFPERWTLLKTLFDRPSRRSWGIHDVLSS